MVSLRALELRDAPAVFRAVDRSRDALRRWMAWYHDDYDLSDAESWIQHTVDAAATGTGFHFAMVDSTGELVGVISLEDVRPESGRAMLGYWMATPATGRGLGGQAVAQIVAWARERCNLLILWAVAADANLASRRVLERNGFRQAGSRDRHERGDLPVIYELGLDARSVA